MVPTLRKRGARNIAINYRCWDRGEFGDQFRWARARSVCEHSDMGGDIEQAFLTLASWGIGLGCAAHDTHKALAWSMLPHTPDARRIAKDLWVVVQSLRNSFGVVQAHIPLVVQACIFGYDDATDDEVSEKWQALGVDPDLLSEVVWARPEVDRGFLRVH